MKTKAVRIHGKGDLRLDEFDLPPIGEDEILARVVSDSICMSSYKAAIQGPDHKRVPDDCAERPPIIGHEFCGEILEVGARWQDQFKPGEKFAIQPALGYKGSLEAPGYSFPYIGGDATHIIIPSPVMECGCLLHYRGPGWFPASLSEPMSCIVGAFHASYHTVLLSYEHQMGIREGGRAAILAGCGPMGLGAVDYALHCDRRPAQLVVTDIDQERLDRAQKLLPPEEGARCGVELTYVNTAETDDPVARLIEISGGDAYDDVFVFAPVRPVVEQGDAILGRDGCLNFFAGPTDPEFRAAINFYNVHYTRSHLVGTSGGNTDDMKESLELMAAGRINPAGMITHVGGLNAVVDTTLNLPKIHGGKKLIYVGIELELAAIDEFARKGESDPLFRDLAEICERNHGIWSLEAERHLLEHAPPHP
jgi:threonine dehydrogenase-like Zn-dependent dehydrogenase